MQTFDAFFRKATGKKPYDFQRALATAAQPPPVLAVPTGSGKTHALLLAWLYTRRELKRGPRRLVYALPMRTLVEQTVQVARDIRSALAIPPEELRIHVLMGGEPPSEDDDWRRYPETDQILIGTIDMLLSRALNRGYAESRFAWPIAFGLLNSDCRWIFDEIQLMGPARTTSAQLDGLRAKLGTALPCETTWVSATVDRDSLLTYDRPELGNVMTLPDTDRCGRLTATLTASKEVERVDLSAAKPATLAREIATNVLARHQPGTRTIVVLNRVELAQEVTVALDRLAHDGKAGESPEVVLLHSRFRPAERQVHMDRALAPIDTKPGRIVVATQVIEAGVDTSCALLATETAPFSSIVQRLGRCNRYGDHDRATMLWLDRGELDAKQAAPYDPRDIASARTALLDLVGRSASPDALASVGDVPEVRDTWAVLRRRHLVDLFDTAPDLSGFDVDVSRFIRPDDERTVSVHFRNDPGTDPRRAESSELVAVPIGSLGDRRAWIHDHVNGAIRSISSKAIRPGITVMLDAREGGYDERLGWRPESKDAVRPVELASAESVDTITADPDSFTGSWVSLAQHLEDAEREARALVTRLGSLDLPAGASEAVAAAGALHHIGKAHAVFQHRLLATAENDKERTHLGAELWAKSAERGGRPNDGRQFRHELASAVALLCLDGAVNLPEENADLTRYLVLAHHGKVRLIVRSAREETRPADAPADARYVLGVVDGESLPAVETPVGFLPSVTLDLDRLDEPVSWTKRACALRDDPALGPFRLAYLEALVRVADWRASA